MELPAACFRITEASSLVPTSKRRLLFRSSVPVQLIPYQASLIACSVLLVGRTRSEKKLQAHVIHERSERDAGVAVVRCMI